MYSRESAKTRVKLLANAGEDKNLIIEEILKLIEEYVLAFLKVDLIPDCEGFIVEIALKYYNRLQSEGFKSENIEGMSISYEDFKETYGALFKAFRKLRTL
jgi:hypothetical protein